MEFDAGQKVIINSLNMVEAKAYLIFLDVQESRHRNEIEKSAGNMKNASGSGLDKALCELEQSSILRHMSDIEGIRSRRTQVYSKFGWLERFNRW